VARAPELALVVSRLNLFRLTGLASLRLLFLLPACGFTPRYFHHPLLPQHLANIARPVDEECVRLGQLPVQHGRFGLAVDICVFFEYNKVIVAIKSSTVKNNHIRTCT